MTRPPNAKIPALVFGDSRRFEALAAAAGISLDGLSKRIAGAAVRGLCFCPDGLRVGRPVSQGHTNAVVAELHADDFVHIVKLRAGRSLSAERRGVAEACCDLSIELKRFLLPPIHVETLVRRKSLPGGVLEMALYEHGRAAGGWQSGLASWREILLHSPRLLPESALALARVWRTQNAGLGVKRVPLASSPVYRDKTEKLARASAPPDVPGGARVPLDRYLDEGPPSTVVAGWVRRHDTRRAMTRRVLGRNPRIATAPGFMHGDLHGDNILLHFADDAPSGFSIIDLELARAGGCALYDWAKLTLDLLETQYSTPVFLEMPSARVADRAGEWCGELARRLLGMPAAEKRWRVGESAGLLAALHLRDGLTPEMVAGEDLIRVLFLNALFSLRYISYRNMPWDDPALVRNVVLYAAAADAFARVLLNEPANGDGDTREPLFPFDCFQKPPSGVFRRAWLSGKRAARLPAGPAGDYLRAVSPPPDSVSTPGERANLLEGAAIRALDAGDAFLAGCCRLAWADTARDRDPAERHAVLTTFVDGTALHGVFDLDADQNNLLRGLAFHYRGVLSATRPGPDMDAAMADLARATAILNGTPFSLEAARANNSLGHYAVFRHDFALAGQYLNEAWFAREPFDPPWESAVTQGCLATHARRLGDFREALRHYAADLALCDRASRDSIEQKAAETRLALLARERRRGALADVELLEAALTPVRRLLARKDRKGAFWNKCRLIAETLRLEAGLPADAGTGRALAAGRRSMIMVLKAGGMDYPTSHVARWLGRLEAAREERGTSRELLDAVLAYWRRRSSVGELLSSRLDASGMADTAVNATPKKQVLWRGLVEELHVFRRDLGAPPELAWRIDPALRRLERSLTGGAPQVRRDAVREVQVFLEY